MNLTKQEEYVLDCTEEELALGLRHICLGPRNKVIEAIPFATAQSIINRLNAEHHIVELATFIAKEWKRLLLDGRIFETTPELRDALSRLSGEISQP